MMASCHGSCAPTACSLTISPRIVSCPLVSSHLISSHLTYPEVLMRSHRFLTRIPQRQGGLYDCGSGLAGHWLTIPASHTLPTPPSSLVPKPLGGQHLRVPSHHVGAGPIVVCACESVKVCGRTAWSGTIACVLARCVRSKRTLQPAAGADHRAHPRLSNRSLRLVMHCPSSAAIIALISLAWR